MINNKNNRFDNQAEDVEELDKDSMNSTSLKIDLHYGSQFEII